MFVSSSSPFHKAFLPHKIEQNNTDVWRLMEDMCLQKQHLNHSVNVREVLSGESEWKMATACHPFHIQETHYNAQNLWTIWAWSVWVRHASGPSPTLLKLPGCNWKHFLDHWCQCSKICTSAFVLGYKQTHISTPTFHSNSNKFQYLQYESVNTNFTHSTFSPPV